MDTLDAIKQMLEESGRTANAVSVQIGKHRNFIASTIYKGSTPRADTLSSIADAMGYDLLLRRDGHEIRIDPVRRDGRA